VYLDHSISCKIAALADISLFSQLPISKTAKPTQLFVVGNNVFCLSVISLSSFYTASVRVFLAKV
jgi:hypothetical protein